MKIGYHYTTTKTLWKIKEKGFILTNNISIPHIPPTQGIWLWKDLPEGKDHLFNLLRVLSDTGETAISCICFRYDESKLLDPTIYGVVEMYHNHEIGKFKAKSPQALVLMDKVPVSDIIYTRDYFLEELVS